MTEPAPDDPFESARPMLLGLAYRILGSRTDAEDAVQDTYLKWMMADPARIDNASSWLTTVCTRRCIDLLRSAHRTRVNYVGTWLPEPLHTRVTERPDERLSMAASLETAFLLLLERLTPKERAAYLLHEIFETPYSEIAAILEVQEATVRKLVSRARANVDQSRVRYQTPIERQDQLLAAFGAAIAGHGTDRLAGLLSEDVVLRSDGGGKVSSVRQPLHGKAEVLRFVDKGLRIFWGPSHWAPANINGGRGILVRQDGKVTSAVTFAYDDTGALTDIFIMRNPSKLASLGHPPPFLE